MRFWSPNDMGQKNGWQDDMTCEMMQPFVKASSYYAEHRLLFQLLVVFALAMQALDSFCFTLVYCVKTYGIRTAVM